MFWHIQNNIVMMKILLLPESIQLRFQEHPQTGMLVFSGPHTSYVVAHFTRRFVQSLSQTKREVSGFFHIASLQLPANGSNLKATKGKGLTKIVVEILSESSPLATNGHFLLL